MCQRYLHHKESVMPKLVSMSDVQAAAQDSEWTTISTYGDWAERVNQRRREQLIEAERASRERAEEQQVEWLLKAFR